MPHRGTEAVSSRREQDPFGETALIIRIEVRHFASNDDRDTDSGCRQVAGVGSINRRQSRQSVAIANNDELPRLAVPGAARPTRDFENILEGRFRKRIRP